MKRLTPFIFLLLMTPLKVNAACSGAECCAVSGGVTTLPISGSCAIVPDSYGITIYEKYLCTSAPTAPTTTSSVDLSNCVKTLNAPAGSTVRITQSTTANFTDGTFTRPPNGVYTHGIMLIKNVFLLKFSLELDRTWDGTDGSALGGNGVYCATKNTTGYEEDGSLMQCDSSPVTAGELSAGMNSFGYDVILGVKTNYEFSASATNLNGTGASISGYLLNTDGYLATSTLEVEAYERLLGINAFAAPVVVTPETSGFDMAFGINQGATIWDIGTNEAGDRNIGGGSGPFQAIITPINY